MHIAYILINKIIILQAMMTDQDGMNGKPKSVTVCIPQANHNGFHSATNL